MKVVFLDIDGVLFTWDQLLADPQRASAYQAAQQTNNVERWSTRIVPENVAVLAQLLEDPAVELVLISAWRTVPGVGVSQQALALHGIDPDRFAQQLLPVMVGQSGTTAELRGMAIQEWVRRVQRRHTPLEGMVILDDVNPRCYSDRWIEVRAGLAEIDVEAARVLLNTPLK